MPSPAQKEQPNEGESWRATIQQSARNAEVREIAKVLASLEPGASTASKLRLAMQFEDSVFKLAESFADYRKRLTKRLKRVQKSYTPTQQAAFSNKENALQELRRTYGESLRYIIKHTNKALQVMRSKHGDEKAGQFKQHYLDEVKLWAADLGVTDNTQPNLTMSDEHLEKLKLRLEKRVDNIRTHVSKLADPDRFLLETLEKTEKDFKDKPAKVLALDTKKRYQQLQKKEMDPQALLKESMERAQKAVPLPTRNQRNDERAALIHLDKMRAASTALVAYMSIIDKDTVPRNTVIKAHTIATDGIEFVKNVMREHRKNSKEPKVSLEDAWVKPLELPNAGDTSEPPEKRPKTALKGPVVRSQVLLTAGRKTPSNLLPALKRKRAKLIRPPPQGQGSHLVLEFGEAFVMTIFFVPLLVTLRAYQKEESQHQESTVKCAAWTPLHGGLVEMEQLTVWGATGTYETLGHAVEERLRDASANATRILRKAFASAAKENAGEFEVEILEATALLEFLHLARTTYIPDWQDDDD